MQLERSDGMEPLHPPRQTRRGVVAGAAALAGALAAACRAPAGGREGAPAIGARDVALRLWHWDSFLIEPFQRHSAEFTGQYPRIKVEVEHTPKGQYVDKLVAQVTGGAPPDTIGVSVTSDFNMVQSTGMVRVIDSLLKRDRYDLNDFFDVNLRQHKWGGKQIGLPYGWTTIVFFYNEALFTIHGVKTPYEHWRAGTWTRDTYVDLVQRFNRVGDNVFGTVSLPANNNLAFSIISAPPASAQPSDTSTPPLNATLQLGSSCTRSVDLSVRYGDLGRRPDCAAGTAVEGDHGGRPADPSGRAHTHTITTAVSGSGSTRGRPALCQVPRRTDS